MILDAHVHIESAPVSSGARSALLSDMAKAGVSGGVIMSPDPVKFSYLSSRERMFSALALCEGSEQLFPFYWIDPTDSGALEQVEEAVKNGIMGFKIICSGFYPSDVRVMEVCRRAAELNKPVIFHSGILWDGRDSSRYNRPGEFECLLEIPGLRFSLAHISWPWCDECIAVYGKFANACAIREDITSEMFVDITPGTPKLWRKEAMQKLLCGGYDVMHNVMFGTDCSVEDYNWRWAQDWIEFDRELINGFGIDETGALSQHIFYDNLLRFVGLSSERVERISPLSAV